MARIAAASHWWACGFSPGRPRVRCRVPALRGERRRINAKRRGKFTREVRARHRAALPRTRALIRRKLKKAREPADKLTSPFMTEVIDDDRARHPRRGERGCGRRRSEPGIGDVEYVGE